ncbi:MAG: OmpA family protein [Saprospiraceae bacterium]
MSSRFLVLAVFALWSGVSWYWYVCGIKQQCSDRPAMVQQAVPFEPETILGTDDQVSAYTPTEPIEHADNSATDPQPVAAEPDISKAHVEELADHSLIHFPYNSTRKEDDAAIDAYLSRLADQLTSSGTTVTLIGHTDNVGDSKTNLGFALRRAKNIRDILIAKGVAKKQIVCKTKGENQPLGSNDKPRGRYQNRRVEVRVGQ